MDIHSALTSRALVNKIQMAAAVLLLNIGNVNSAIASSTSINTTDEFLDVTVIAINVAGRQQKSNTQDRYLADAYFTGGTATDINEVDIKGTGDDILFLSKRSGDFSYNIPLENGTYDVTLLFAELTHQETGARQFNINVENTIVATNLDLFAEAGFFSAHSITANDLDVTDSILNIQLTSVVDSAKLSAIHVSRKVVASNDEDGDGVINSKDACIYTPSEYIFHINTQGCSPHELDTDDDGVNDPYDVCIATPAFELVDSFGCSLSQKDTDYDGLSDDIDQCDYTPFYETIDSKGCGIYSESEVTSSPFMELFGLVVIELESTNYSEGWQRFSGDLASGNGYLQWMGEDYFDTPGNGLIDISVYIHTPGTYKFLWLNSVKKGDSSTDHNDSWLKIIADSFYGKKPDNHIVCPHEQDSANDCVGNLPNGSGKEGWFKIWRFNGPITEWFWRAKTSDNDGHDIFARFDSPGIYHIQVSGRSAFHAIDRLVLFRAENSDFNVDEAFATSLDRAESWRMLY